MLLHHEVESRYCPDVPLIWHRPGVVGLGTDPHIIVSDVRAEDLRWLMDLGAAAAGAACSTEPNTPGQLRLLAAARAAGALEHHSDASDAWRMLPIDARARMDGELAAYRHTYRSSERAHTAMAARITLRISLRGQGRLHDACVAAARATELQIDDDDPDVVLLTSMRHPDALPIAATDERGIMQVPHLPVAIFGNRGVIGPMVDPGETACTMCWHLRQQDRDPQWSLQAAQLAGFTPPIWPGDRVMCAALAAHALLTVLTWRAHPRERHLWANRITTIWLPNGSVDVSTVVPHPACGCIETPLSGISTKG